VRLAEARLEISDGAERNWIPVEHGLSSATYVPASSDVRVRLIAGKRTEDAHFVRIPQEETEIAQLETQAKWLRGAIAENRKRSEALERILATLK
jgi:hypothetical protein